MLVAVTVRLPSVAGAVNRPDDEIVPAVADQVTAELKLPVPCTVAVHWAVPPVVTVDGWQLTDTDVMVAVLETETTVDPLVLGCWVLLAVTVTFPGVVGAVSTPDDEIVPAVANQVTAELKLPVPCTVAVHWAVPPVVTVDGWQLTDTDVMVAGLEMETTVDPLVLGCWILVAVTVTFPGVVGAVSTPDDEIVPAVADQVTAEL